jgi:hypothetical protein
MTEPTQTQLRERAGSRISARSSNRHRRRVHAAPQVGAAPGKARHGQVYGLTRRAECVDLSAVVNGQRSEDHAFTGHLQSSARIRVTRWRRSPVYQWYG